MDNLHVPVFLYMNIPTGQKRCCPHCGSRDLFVNIAHMGGARKHAKYYVECQACDHMGPLAQTQDEAIKKFNSWVTDPLVALLQQCLDLLPETKRSEVEGELAAAAASGQLPL